MKFAGCIRGVFAIGVAAGCLAPWLSGCTSPRAEPTRPAAAAPATQPDGYPNLNLPVRPAAPQLTEEERARLVQELSAKRPAGAGGAAPTGAEAERLRLLALRHAQERLRQIEAAQ